MKHSIILSICLSMLFGSQLTAQGISFQHDNWKSILAQAKSENKLIFLDAYTTWCGPCKAMAKDIFTNDKVAAIYNSSFINAKIDMEKGEGLELASKYNVQAYPTLLFIDGDGEVQHKALGFQNVEQFLELADKAKDLDSRLGTLNRAYQAGNRDPDFLYKLAHTKLYANEEDAIVVAEQYLATQSDWNTKENLDFVFTFAGDLDNPMSKWLLGHKDAFLERYGQKVVDTKVNQMLETGGRSLPADVNWEEWETLVKSLNPKSADRIISKLKMDHQMGQKKYDDYISQALVHYKIFSSAETMELNGVAWTAYLTVKNPDLLKGAIKLAEGAIKKDPQYYIMDTVAALYSKLGDKRKTKLWVNKAVAQAKKEGVDASETLEYLKAK